MLGQTEEGTIDWNEDQDMLQEMLKETDEDTQPTQEE
jgi:hypothetical protein